MSLRICIPTAGTGSRLEDLTAYVNKSLVSIANRPAISHLIEQCPSDSEFVIALGHKGHLVRQFLELAYPNRVFFFSEVEPYEGPGSGLGLSLIKCKDFLQQPFIFMSCDTLVREPFPSLDFNWVGYAERDDLTQYRTVKIEGSDVCAICEKGEGSSPSYKPYIGLAGVVDYELFWSSMETGGAEAISTGEAFGLRSLLVKGINAQLFTWYDTGNPRALEQARDAYNEPDSPNILPKANEAIWFVDGQVIKFSDSRDFIANRVKRSIELNPFVPFISGVKSNMYRYSKVEGNVLSDVVTLPLFNIFLKYCTSFWKECALESVEREKFNAQCLKFYKDKTYERVDQFYRTFGLEDGTEIINGESMPLLSTILNRIDWDELATGLPGRFHGDFHFENILWSEPNQKFTFLDWRQDFGGSLTVGDVYYDLAKLLHGMIISHELIASNHYHIEWQKNEIKFDFHRKQMLVECERHFTAWMDQMGFSVDKVQILTALIYLNIAALHHAPYSHLLYALGKSMLYRVMDNCNK